MRRNLGRCALLFWFAGCGGVADNGGGNDASVFGDGGAGGLVVMPPETTVDLPAGGPAGHATFMAVTTADGQDVSASASWSLDDTSLGAMSGPQFTSNVTKGGTTMVRASWHNLTGAALLHVKLHATVDGGCNGNCPKFPDLPATPCAAGSDPKLVYPPDGVLLPPNMNVMEVQFTPGTGDTLFEVDFENTATDVRVVTACNPIKDTRGVATGGCAYDLDQKVWDFLATTNRGGEPINVTVRGTTDGMCATPSNARAITFAEQDLQGVLYYWQSIVVGQVAGKAGGIFKYDFGVRNTTSEPFLTPATGSCVGCHFLSRDGLRMTYGSDDADSDDEYGDLAAHLLDVGSKQVIATTSPSLKPIPPGFQTFTHDHKVLLGTQGSTNNATSFLLWDGDQGGSVTGMAPTPMRGTQPDWSADDKQVVYVVPKKFANQFSPNPYSRPDDDHFLGGSLFTIAYNNGQWGAPQAIIASKGENNYYPSWSPDSPPSFLIFNRVDGGGTDLAQDAFNNPKAKVWILSTKQGAAPIEATRLNDTGDLTNSWPRWSPFIQTYHGEKLLWVTFSSTRDYGLKVRNHVKVPDLNGNMVDQVNCYPPDSPQNLNGSHQQPLPPNCNQPQIWMAAINLSQAEFGGNDASFPAFWLPFQEVTAHNHIAQWAEKSAPMGCGDGGMCIPDGQACGNNCPCCGGDVCDNGVCSMVIP